MDNCFKDQCRLERVTQLQNIYSLLEFIFKNNINTIIHSIFFCAQHVVLHYCEGSECFLDRNGTCKFTGIDQSDKSDNYFDCNQYYNNPNDSHTISNDKNQVCFNFTKKDKFSALDGEAPESFVEDILRKIDSKESLFFNRKNERFMKISKGMYSGFINFCQFNLSKNKAWSKNPLGKIAKTKHQWISDIASLILQTQEISTPNTEYIIKKYTNRKYNSIKNKVIVKNFIHLLRENTSCVKSEWWKRKACLSNISVTGSGITYKASI
jgi:hypothetical protein